MVEFEAQFVGKVTKEIPEGLAWINFIRRELQLDLPLDRIFTFHEFFRNFGKYKCQYEYAYHSFTEEEAEECGHFSDTLCVKVKVPDGWIDRFYVPYVEIERDNETGEVVKAGLGMRIDWVTIYRIWKELDFQLEIK